MKQSIWWPVGISAITFATLLAVLADIESPVRPALVFIFIFLCPGLAYVRLLGLGNRILEWTLSVAFSISVATLVSEAMLFAGLWSSPRILVIIVLITAIGIVLQLWRLSQATDEANAGRPAESHA
ncbi:MAG: hypothetical protein AAF614_15935 [Chloroflexota bacterium]